MFIDVRAPKEIDGAKTNMARLRVRMLYGQRLNAKALYGQCKTLTFVAVPRSDRIDAPFVLDGPVNLACLLTYVEQTLVRTLTRGDIVVMDNFGSHEVTVVLVLLFVTLEQNCSFCRSTART